MEQITQALNELRAGRPIVVVDHPSRENEGDLIAAAQLATPELINFMITEARGLVCAPVTSDRARTLGLEPMVPATSNKEPYRCNFTVSVDAAQGITTGISTVDRALTIQLLASEQATAKNFVKPGHIFPLIARPKGVLERAGHTEATTDLLKLAGLIPVGVICEILNRDGTMARGEELEVFAKKHKLVMISVDDVIRHVSL